MGVQKTSLTAGKNKCSGSFDLSVCVSLIPKCNSTPGQRYLYPWGADGEAEVVQRDERVGYSL